MQIFSNRDPEDVARNQVYLSNDRTALLTDSAMATCFTVPHNSNRHLLWMKVLTSRAYLFGKVFSAFVAGKKFSCSPVDGISVAVQPSCHGNGNCIPAVPCTARKAHQKAGLFVCEFQCKTLTTWTFVAININDGGLDFDGYQELCEIWFSK